MYLMSLLLFKKKRGGGTVDIGSGVYFGTQFSNTVEEDDETQTRYFFTLNNESGRTGDSVLRRRSIKVFTFFGAIMVKQYLMN